MAIVLLVLLSHRMRSSWRTFQARKFRFLCHSVHFLFRLSAVIAFSVAFSFSRNLLCAQVGLLFRVLVNAQNAHSEHSAVKWHNEVAIYLFIVKTLSFHSFEMVQINYRTVRCLERFVFKN